MTRIVQVIADGRPGGGTAAVLSLSGLLAHGGVEVTIITQEDSYLTLEATGAGFGVIGLDFSRRIRTVRLAAEISQCLKQLKPAIVHAHGARAGLPIALLSRETRGRFVYTVHGFHYLHKPPILNQLAQVGEAFCIARANCTIFVSNADLALASSSHLLRHSRAQRVIKNAVSVDLYAQAKEKIYDIGFLGRLHYQKNPLLLIDILIAMRPLRPTLCVIGGGALEGQLRSRISDEGLEDQVTLLGECDRAKALYALSSCRVMLLPSRWEGHPIALIEAMHLGLPAVASHIPGSDEIVIDGETGYLAPIVDVTAYADRLKTLLTNKALQSRMAGLARRRAARDYSTSQLLAAHLEIYKEC